MMDSNSDVAVEAALGQRFMESLDSPDDPDHPWQWAYLNGRPVSEILAWATLEYTVDVVCGSCGQPYKAAWLPNESMRVQGGHTDCVQCRRPLELAWPEEAVS